MTTKSTARKPKKAWEPAYYSAPDTTGVGRWTVVGNGDGIIWTDDKDSAGVTWVRQTPQVEALWEFFQNARSAGTPASAAYQIAFDAGGVDKDEQYGPITGVGAVYLILAKAAEKNAK